MISGGTFAVSGMHVAAGIVGVGAFAATMAAVGPRMTQASTLPLLAATALGGAAVAGIGLLARGHVPPAVADALVGVGVGFAAPGALLGTAKVQSLS